MKWSVDLCLGLDDMRGGARATSLKKATHKLYYKLYGLGAAALVLIFFECDDILRLQRIPSQRI